jgi:putative DNA primase/helicase
MGFARDELGPAECQKIAEELFTDIDRIRGTKINGCCPVHGENTASAFYDFEKDVFSCSSCGFKGDLVKLWCEVHNLDDHGEGFKEFKALFVGSVGSGSSGKKAKPKKKPRPVPVPEVFVSETELAALQPLPPERVRELREQRGWTPEIIERLHLRLFTDFTGKQRIAMPIFNDDGVLCNIRLYLPGAKEYKLISWFDQSCQACGGKFKVVKKKKTCQACGALPNDYGRTRLYPSPKQWKKEGLVWVVEGESDLLCALSQGLNAVTQTAGCGTWPEDFSPAFAGRDVVIAYDADKPGLLGAEKVATSLAKHARSVRVLLWTPTEMMADGQTEKPGANYTKFVLEHGVDYPADHGLDLTDWFMRLKRTAADLNDLLATAVTFSKPIEPEMDASLERYFKGRKFMPARLAAAIMDDLEVVSDPRTGVIYRWEGRFWEEYSLDYLRQLALRMLADEANSAKASDVAAMVRDLSTLPIGRRMNDHTDLICLQNGMFSLEDYSLRSHAKDFYSTHCLGVPFDPDKAECPRWIQFLKEAVKDPAVIRELQKFFGYCLTRETRYEKMLLIHGPGGDGKSVLMDVLKNMIGEENCSHIPMGRLEDQFYLSRLVDKLVNMSTEIEAKAMQSQELKAIVSGDPISASFKNQTPFDYTPFCKLVYSTNRLPKMLDNSDGFFRRLLIIHMQGRFVKEGTADLFLREKLLEEQPGIFAWALVGLEMLREEGFVEVEAMKKNLDDYKRINNNVLYFIQQHVVFDKGIQQSKVIKSEVYEEYVRRCKSWNLMPYAEPMFRTEFLRLLRDMDQAPKDGKITDESNRRRNAYVGFHLIDEKEEPDAVSPAPLSPEAFHE